MPSKSPAQRHLMQAVAHNPQFATKVGIPQSVGAEFSAADHARALHEKANGKEMAAADHARRMHVAGKAHGAKHGG